MKQVSPEIQDLGVANGWKETPEVVISCRSVASYVPPPHWPTETKIGKTRTEIRCDICGYRYEYDSS
ncbi:hypothetical protein LCGC14_1642960 [marine sediment metagenome]|uniref:Uncharacterized protein n=1 Tax=marine sediment metagenome TaxID=412755 RepID=A0A0F9KYU6_9ZZZZ